MSRVLRCRLSLVLWSPQGVLWLSSGGLLDVRRVLGVFSWTVFWRLYRALAPDPDQGGCCAPPWTPQLFRMTPHGGVCFSGDCVMTSQIFLSKPSEAPGRSLRDVELRPFPGQPRTLGVDPGASCGFSDHVLVGCLGLEGPGTHRGRSVLAHVPSKSFGAQSDSVGSLSALLEDR